MEAIDKKSNLAKYFLEDNFVEQQVYKAKVKFIPLYINAELYEQIFNVKYEEESAFENISKIFSITLNKEKSNNELLGNGYAD